MPAASAPAQGSAADLTSRLESLLLLAETRAAEGRAALGNWPQGETAEQRRQVQWFKALAIARLEGLNADFEAARSSLQASSQALSPRLAQADDQLFEALKLDRNGSRTEKAARQALENYEAYCGSLTPPAPDCLYRERWLARTMLSRGATDQQALSAARTHGLAAVELATAGRDARRQAIAESGLANLAASVDDLEQANLHQERARQLAGKQPDDALALRLVRTDATMALARKDIARSQTLLQRALVLARQMGAPRVQAVILGDISDLAAKSGKPAMALAAAEQGLAVLQGQPPGSLQRTLGHNSALARLALGQIEASRAQFEGLQKEWAAAGATGVQLQSMREYGDALAARGDFKGALEMHHRERELAEQLMAANREAALAELRTRYDREAQQRRILLLERDNAVKSATLVNQSLNQRLWAVAGIVLGLAGFLLLLLVRRVRETQRKLVSSQAQLRVQSERDALTGLYSRRHAQTLMQASAQGGTFIGTLLMIDIDHFKQINDQYGHAVGDQVIIEVARRLSAHAGEQQMVARWGGEEFIVHAQGLNRTESDNLAGRLLYAIGAEPFHVRSGADDSTTLSLRVTVSVGRGMFPLPPRHVPLTLDQALNLADMALYTAKGQGRHRAVGIVGCTATDAAALQAIELDFERAWEDGRVNLHFELGPGPTLDAAKAVHTVIPTSPTPQASATP